MRQRTFASQAEFQKYRRNSRRELFLDEMERIVPWSGLLALARGCYEVHASCLKMLAIMRQAKLMEWKPLRVESSRS
jgi:hypothetical protein